MLDPTKCFRVTAIRLDSASFESLDGISETLLERDQCTVQTRRWTNHKFVERLDSQFLLATVHIGIRLIESQDDAQPVEIVFYSIQASFVAEFEVVSKEYDETSFDEFLSKNVAHVVWPFWRQHVYSTLQAASLPLLPIPLMAGHQRAILKISESPIPDSQAGEAPQN